MFCVSGSFHNTLKQSHTKKNELVYTCSCLVSLIYAINDRLSVLCVFASPTLSFSLSLTLRATRLALCVNQTLCLIARFVLYAFVSSFCRRLCTRVCYTYVTNSLYTIFSFIFIFLQWHTTHFNVKFQFVRYYYTSIYTLAVCINIVQRAFVV